MMKQSVTEETARSEIAVSVPVPGPYQSGASFYLSSILYSVPLVCFSGALLADISYLKDPDVQWSNFSAWLLAFGVLFMGAAILVGITGFLITLGRKRRPANWLFGLSILAAAVVGLFDNFIHSHDGWTSVWPTGLALSAVATLLLFIAILLKVISLSNTYVMDAK